MGIQIIGSEEVEMMFSELDKNAKRRLRRAMVKQGMALQALAVTMAPREYGNLEESIKLRGGTGAAQERDESGRMGRIEVEVYVDMDMAVPERPGKTVGDYAYEIHEHLEPVGNWALGDASRDKQAGQQEQVGGGYMNRAAAEIEASLDKALLDIFDDFL